MRPLLSLLLVATLLAAGCAKHDHDHDKPSASAHAHTAPHGGILVELGDHAANLELVRDHATGRLSAYILDGHAENFLRVKAPSFPAIATVGAEKRPLLFKAVANPATGETVGDTSQFDAEADWLKSPGPLQLSIASLEVRGATFSNISASLAK